MPFRLKPWQECPCPALENGDQALYLWELFRFIEWLMVLPEKYEFQFEKVVKE